MTFYAKVWCDMLGDEKLMRGARKGGKQIALLPWFITFAKKADDDGRLTVGGEAAEPDDIAAGIPGVTPKQVGEGLQSLEAIGVLVPDDDGVLRFAKWDKRNSWAPSDTKEEVGKRVAKHRAKKRGETIDAADDVTTPVTGDVTRGETGSVTTPVTTARSRDEEEDEDLDLDRDKDSSSSSARDASLVLQVVTGTARRELDRLLSHVPVRESWLTEMDAALSGMHGVTLTPAQLGQAIHDYVGNGASSNPSLKHFRGYLRSAAAPPNGAKTATQSPTNGVRRRSHMNPGEQQVANILGTSRGGDS